MIYVQIALGFFGASAAVGLGITAFMPGGVREHWKAALGVCIGVPLMIIACGVVMALLGWIGRAILAGT